ncbi:MAG: DUF4465 domain-containing protein [Bacteroidales bacterium]
MKKNVLFAMAMAAFILTASCEKKDADPDLIDFEELKLDQAGYWDGSDGSGGFISGDALFPNRYDNDWQSWSGFAYTNHTDVVTSGYENMYSSITGSGAGASEKYALYNYYSGMGDTVWFDMPAKITGISFSNTTYAYMTMLNGNPFAKKFGGETGSDPDWFKVTITGITSEGNISESRDIMLADFRFDDDNRDYILYEWKEIDLSSLGYVKGLAFEISSSDTGQWGINTPAYVCIDDIRYIPLVIAE